MKIYPAPNVGTWSLVASLSMSSASSHHDSVASKTSQGNCGKSCSPRASSSRRLRLTLTLFILQWSRHLTIQFKASIARDLCSAQLPLLTASDQSIAIWEREADRVLKANAGRLFPDFVANFGQAKIERKLSTQRALSVSVEPVQGVQ